MAVYLLGTLDTKGEELGFVRDLLQEAGIETVVVDVGSAGPPRIAPDVPREVVFARAGVECVTDLKDRGEAVTLAAEGVAKLAHEWLASGKLEGILGIGGSAGAVIATSAMRQLPFGIPKVMVTTVASGQTRPFVMGSDIAMFHPVADISGLNRLTRSALRNATNALVGMVRGRNDPQPELAPKSVVGATMFGVTTRCVEQARELLEQDGREVLVFHATGVGGQAMEGLIRDGLIDAVLDITTTELADEVVGGVLSAGPDRLKAAVRRGLPQVISVGALDMVNFGAWETVPERFRGRLFHRHNATVTLMRTTPAENEAIGRWMVDVLSQSTADVVVMLPLKGVSALDAEGMPFHDPEADAALFRVLHEGLDSHPNVTVVDRPHHINDPLFALEAVLALKMIAPAEPAASSPNQPAEFGG